MTKTNNTIKRGNSTIRKITRKKKLLKEEDNVSSEISDDEVLFLGIKESNDIEEIEHKEDEAEVNMEEELLNALDGLRRYKNKYRQLKSLVVEQQEEHEHKEKEMKKIMSNMKHQIQEANRIEERL